jgi:hypothetical protein
MDNRQKVWLWAAAALSFVVGLIFIWNDSAAGWIFLVLGLMYLGVSLRAGQKLGSSAPSLVRWALVGVFVLLILLVVVVGAVFLLK